MTIDSSRLTTDHAPPGPRQDIRTLRFEFDENCPPRSASWNVHADTHLECRALGWAVLAEYEVDMRAFVWESDILVVKNGGEQYRCGSLLTLYGKTVNPSHRASVYELLAAIDPNADFREPERLGDQVLHRGLVHFDWPIVISRGGSLRQMLSWQSAIQLRGRVSLITNMYCVAHES